LPDPFIRPARPEDRDQVAELIYLSASGAYDIYAGSRERALRIIGAAFDREGTDASRDVVLVAELDGRVAAAMAAFPVPEGHRRAMRFLSVTLLRTPPWRWPRTLQVFRTGSQITPVPPARSFYVDALATHPDFRRRGAATALLAEAERIARELGLTHVALDTVAADRRARGLYESAGFHATAERQGKGPIPAIVGLVKPV
jgi:ribosomal protein S18 acetylase RimI-like enzyme